MKVGDKIKFVGEKQRFTVQALNERFVICTKPFNLKKTVFYSIIDLKENVRGRDNLVFGFWDGYESKQSCELALEELKKGEMEVSRRNRVPLKIEKIYAN